FFDALPVHQAVKQADGWHERVVHIDRGGKLAFALGLEPLRAFGETLSPEIRGAPVGTIYEWRSDPAISDVGRRALLGAALVIDYGQGESAAGETLQAMHRHRYSSPLAAPGLSDLTAHVDFAALARAATTLGARAHGPIAQAVFLKRIGIEARAAMLKKS